METKTKTGDVIHHTTHTTFDFKDRIKILFGGEVIIKSEIRTGHEQALVKGSSATIQVRSRLFNWTISGIISSRDKNGLYINSFDNKVNSVCARCGGTGVIKGGPTDNRKDELCQCQAIH